MTPYYQDDAVTLYHGDSRDILPSMPSVDLVIADPPYTLGLQSNMKTQGWGDLMNGAMFYEWLLERARKLPINTQGAAWIFNAWRGLPVLMKASYAVEWPITSLLVWDKQWIGPGGQQGLRPSYEVIALFCQPEFQISDRGLPDMWQSPYSSQRPHGHPAEKPEALISKMIQESGSSSVLDPFAGSGTTLAAAKVLGKQAIGVEIEERYCEMIANRLAQSVMAL